LSIRENPTNVVFSKSGRFGEVKVNERMKNRGKGPYVVPGPGAYLTEINHLPHHRGKPYSPAPSLGVRHSQHIWISKSHFAEYQGRCSPGPMYDISGQHRGVFPPTKTPTFGKGERTPLAKLEKVPGPGAYTPDIKETIIQGPSIGFARSRRMTKDTTDSPGPVYTPTYDFSEKGQHVVRIGNGPEEDYERERFNAKIFLGNKLGVDAVGRDSPGPMYFPGQKWDGPAYTIQFKEKKVRKSIFPRPERARWISEQTAKENLGAWSPGPKYDTRGDISREGIAYSFTGSNTNREQEEQLQQQDHSNNNNNKDTSSANASRTRKIDEYYSGNESGVRRKSPAGVSAPMYNPDISVLSTTKPIHSVVISSITERKSPPGRARQQQDSASRGGGRRGNATSSGNNTASAEVAADHPTSLYNPKDDLTRASAPAFSFGKGDRSSSIWNTNQDKQQKGTSSVTGTGMLNINYSQVEHQNHGPRLGGLSLPGF
jgi:hypothetical protein